ncbi:MAG: Transcriptional regulator, MerR family [Candidatus Kaiserbacteria bacterium GW2011_GWA2_49_19]|uniref:Transcriptional regulator, MerR family n=1 Tax=Candidatus Kaiserbacteria bacterium GW2011_GWA2_49_19 TaxID=1618669 RepID=A0A0G1YSX7_9BACT|nr:MAG: Transcriptional regulator, MerR family [Candidatus Kaiserbacteria bacterium GW2011_GWA2_49_19]
MNNKFMLIKEAALFLQVSKLTLRNWDRAGKLTAYRHPISNYRVYRVEDLEKIIKRMESGEKPIRPKKLKQRKLNVIHLKD